MKIGSTPDASVLGETALRAGRAGAPAAVRSATDQVALSAAGTQIQNLGSPDFDEAKVQTIRQAIRDGRFEVNAGAIADRLIADATALLAPRTHS